MLREIAGWLQNRSSKDGTVFVYRTGCCSSLQLPFPLFPPKAIHYTAPAVTDLCACDQTFLILILWVFYKIWLWFPDVCSCAAVQLLCYAPGLSNDFSLTMRLYRNYSLRRVHLHFDDHLICIAALCTILCGNSLWYQNPDSYPTANFWEPYEITWVLVQEQYQLSHQAIWSVLSNVSILDQAHYFEHQIIDEKMSRVPFLHVNFWVHWVSLHGKC